MTPALWEARESYRIALGNCRACHSWGFGEGQELFSPSAMGVVLGYRGCTTCAWMFPRSQAQSCQKQLQVCRRLNSEGGPESEFRAHLTPIFQPVPFSSPTSSILKHTDGIPAECIQERSTDHRVLLSKQSWLQGSHLLPKTHFPPQMRHYQLVLKREWAQLRAGAVLGSMNSPSKGLCPLFAFSQFNRDSVLNALRAKAGGTQPREGQAHSLCHQQNYD